MFTINAQIVVILSDRLMSNAFRCQSNIQNTMNVSIVPNMIAHIIRIPSISINHWFAVQASAHNNFFNSMSL